MKSGKTILIAAAVSAGLLACNGVDKTKTRAGAETPLDIPEAVLPSIPQRSVSIETFGAAGDGVALNTEAFAKAFEELASKGGGRLTVPAGVWLTGPIVLKDNTELNLAEGAILVFSTDKELYPITEAIFEGRDTYRCQSPISARGAKNIAITGRGIIDGSGAAWREVKKEKVSPIDWAKFTASGGVLNDAGTIWYPSESYKLGAGNSDQNVSNWARTAEDFASIKDFLRPVLVYIQDCSHVLLEGVVVQNSPCWNIHTVTSNNITVKDITVRCPHYAQNGDGIDIESCDRVVVRSSVFDVGDDGICIKSGKDEDGRRRGIPCSNIIVDNCTVFHGHGGFVVGSEMSGGVQNVSVTNCYFSGTDVGLRFKSTRGRGGVVENIYIKNIVMNDIATEALLFDLFYGGKSASEALADGDQGQITDMPAMPVDETTPQFRNIHISDVVCRGARRAMLFNGLPEMNVQGVVVENSDIHAQIGAQINESDGVVLHNVTITPENGPALMVNNVRNLTVQGFGAPDGLKTVMQMTGSRNDNIVIEPGKINAGNLLVAEAAAGKVTIK